MLDCDWSSDVCSSDLKLFGRPEGLIQVLRNQGMNLTDHFSPLTQALMHHAVL
jgi:hypothetical protein